MTGHLVAWLSGRGWTLVIVAGHMQLRVVQRGRLVLEGVRCRATGRLPLTLARGCVPLRLCGRTGSLAAGFGQSFGRVLELGLLERRGHDFAGVDPLVGGVIEVLAAERAADPLQSLGPVSYTHLRAHE